MVGAPGPPGVPSLMFLSVFGGRFWTSSSSNFWGPAIDVFNFSGGRCQTYCQHPQGPPPLTSSTSMVATVEPAASTPRGPTVNVFIFIGGRCQTYRKHPPGARHRRLELRWWPLLDLPPAPLGVLPSTSSTSVVSARGPAASTP
jgi:hypothetical protein